LCALIVLAVCSAARAITHKEAIARTHFLRAENLRASLNSKGDGQRSERDYKRVIEAYRRVYFEAPASTKASASALAVAELLADRGRQFSDTQALNAAIKQYEFFRKQYPGSRRRVDALFATGQLYKDDLNDPVRAQAAFQQFIRSYPRNRLADKARSEIAELARSSRPNVQAKNRNEDNSDETESDASPQGDRPRGALLEVRAVRSWSTPDYTRVVLDLDGPIHYHVERLHDPERLLFSLPKAQLVSSLNGKEVDVEDGYLTQLRLAQFKPNEVRIVLQVEDGIVSAASVRSNPQQLIVDLHSRPVISRPMTLAKTTSGLQSSEKMSSAAVAVDTDDDTEVSTRVIQPVSPPFHSQPTAANPLKKFLVDEDAEPAKRDKRKQTSQHVASREAQPNSSGDRSLTRTLGLKIGRIVIDPGHGGFDTGTIGPHGLQEKDLVLDVGLRLGALLEQRLGADVIYTREGDTFIPLGTRTAMANRQQADLFVSVHANSSPNPDARGVETYYLNFTSSPESLEVAARENATSDQSIHQLQDLVKQITLSDKIEESREFADDVQQSLYSGLSTKNKSIHNRGVKKAPFVVLIGAHMPSILAEVSFVSNPKDERSLKTAVYRQRIAESLYKGVARYVGGLSGLKVASAIAKPDGQ
jgi:N-acetylmuramoyl-L-alanine amidase